MPSHPLIENLVVETGSRLLTKQIQNKNVKFLVPFHQPESPGNAKTSATKAEVGLDGVAQCIIDSNLPV